MYRNLVEKPVSIIGPDTYYNSDQEFNAAINGALNAHVSGWESFDFNAPHLLCSGAEDYTTRESTPELNQYDEFKTNSNAPAVGDMWRHLYTG